MMETNESPFDYLNFGDFDIEEMNSVMDNVIESLNTYVPTDLNFPEMSTVDLECDERIMFELIDSINNYNSIIEIDYSLII